MFAIIDCGSTSTRVYLLDKADQIVAKAAVSVGVNSTAQSGSTGELKRGVAACFREALASGGIALEDIELAIAFGMITSELGLLELPHLTAPAGLADLAGQIHVIRDPEVFPLDLPVWFIRGVKNNCPSVKWGDLRQVDLMRGEETQVIGVLSRLRPSLPVNILELGSTTKLIHIDKDGRISGSITSISGQVYDAIKKETFIGKCVRGRADSPEAEGFFSESIVETAKECVAGSGFLRTMLLARFSEIALPTKWHERKFFVESALAADDLKLFDEAEALMKFDLDTDFILIGAQERCRIYQYLIHQRRGFAKKIDVISERAEIDLLAVAGAARIAEKAREFMNQEPQRRG